jgi:hypothetical protein
MYDTLRTENSNFHTSIGTNSSRDINTAQGNLFHLGHLNVASYSEYRNYKSIVNRLFFVNQLLMQMIHDQLHITSLS